MTSLNPTNPPGLTSTASKLELDPLVLPNVSVSTAAPATATISPAIANNTPTNTDVKGLVKGETDCIAKKGTTAIAKMNVAVKSVRSVPVTIFYLFDTTHDGALANMATVMAKVDEIWKSQAIVDLPENGIPQRIDVSNEHFSDPPTEEQLRRYINARPQQPTKNQIFLYVCWDMTTSGEDGFADRHACCVKKDAAAHLVAHEFGHALGIPLGVYNSDYSGVFPGRDKDLMQENADDSMLRIHKYQADIVNR